jgi:hypothetical protein
VDYKAEQILSALAEQEPELVWDYFKDRLQREEEEENKKEGGKFHAVPFQFQGLEKELSKNIRLAIYKGISWFQRDSLLFKYRGGRLLHSVFPQCTPELADSLIGLVRGGVKRK